MPWPRRCAAARPWPGSRLSDSLAQCRPASTLSRAYPASDSSRAAPAPYASWATCARCRASAALRPLLCGSRQPSPSFSASGGTPRSCGATSATPSTSSWSRLRGDCCGRTSTSVHPQRPVFAPPVCVQMLWAVRTPLVCRNSGWECAETKGVRCSALRLGCVAWRICFCACRRSQTGAAPTVRARADSRMSIAGGAAPAGPAARQSVAGQATAADHAPVTSLAAMRERIPSQYKVRVSPPCTRWRTRDATCPVLVQM